MKNRKVGIFYMSRTGGQDRQPVTFQSHTVFIRCEIAKATTLVGALDEAKPRRGEDVMNTHYVD